MVDPPINDNMPDTAFFEAFGLTVSSGSSCNSGKFTEEELARGLGACDQGDSLGTESGIFTDNHLRCTACSTLTLDPGDSQPPGWVLVIGFRSTDPYCGECYGAGRQRRGSDASGASRLTVLVEVEIGEAEGNYGAVAITTATCVRCRRQTESYGDHDRSERRCLALMREGCPRSEANWYTTDSGAANATTFVGDEGNVDDTASADPGALADKE